MPVTRPMRRWFAALAAATCAVAASITVLPSAQAAPVELPPVDAVDKAAASLYIVQLSGDPVVAYDGGVPGLGATKPARGTKLDPNSPQVMRYAGYLTERHDAAVRAVGGRKAYSYTYSYNGFAARLTERQAAALASQPEVLSVTANEVYEIETASTPDFLGLTDPGGLWDALGGVGAAGEDVIIGIIDSGVWPENPAYSDRTATGPNGKPGKLAYRQIAGVARQVRAR
jgi:hypothetical protein